MSTLVLCPSRSRPGAAREVVASFEDTRADPGSRIVFVVDADDPTRGHYPNAHLVTPRGDMGGALRQAAADPALLADATSIGVVGDDCRFRTPGWDRTLDGWLVDNPGVAWPDDGWDHPWSSQEKAAHWWLSRAVVDAMGVAPPTHHLFMDDYWAQLGLAAECARYFPDVVVEHLHPMAGKAPNDATYRRHRRFVAQDRAWFATWQQSGKAADVRRLRTAIGRAAPIRVFADWHHPSLWESLSILFEDRLGWQLYSPGGAGWLGRGWSMSGATPGWTAEDYLYWPDAEDRGDHSDLLEPEYPARRRKLVSREQFAAASWDVVIATLGQHQQSFAKLAQETGATFVHHVGDAKRRIERTNPRAVLIASANVPGAVVHHQEFDVDLFGPAPLQERDLVSSFMLRLGSTSGPWEWLAQSPGLRWWAVECESMRGPGYVAPMADVAAQMRRSGWVWHDKRIGDGYGHVLFTAAAMGRPLIGHASHYAGLLGEHLWQDLVTCVDLDRHDPGEAARLIRAISRDRDWHDEMSAEIRSRFVEAVDFAAEAEAVRSAIW